LHAAIRRRGVVWSKKLLCAPLTTRFFERTQIRDHPEQSVGDVLDLLLEQEALERFETVENFRIGPLRKHGVQR
jgi:hypothetical protein